MARTRGSYNFSANLEIKKTAPLDSRVVVNTKAELTQETTWADEESKVWLYSGLIVSCLEDGNLYMLTDYDPVSAADAYKQADNWKQMNGTDVSVVDNLTSTSATEALSANQGKILNDKITAVQSSLSSVYTYKGSVDNYEELPESEQKVGDTYNVAAAHDNIPAGTNYAWNGESWDALGGSVDLSNYYNKGEVDGAINTALTQPKADIETLKSSVASNTEALNVINGNESTSGSLAHTLKTAKEYTNTQLLNYVQKDEGSSLISAEKLALIDTNASNLAALELRVEANEAAIQLLNGEDTTTGSVKHTVKSAVETALTWNEI